MAELEPRTEFNPWTLDGVDEPPSTSLPAQIAHKVVAANWPEAAMPVHNQLLTAYFTENRNISDWNVLADVVAETGVDRDGFMTMVAEQRQTMGQLVVAEHNEAINQGITAVPTVLINQVLPVPGAQESEAYITWIQRLIDRED